MDQGVENRIEQEREKYRWAFTAPEMAWYGNGDHWKDAADLIRQLSPDSVLDVGTGRGHFLWWLFKNTDAERIAGVDFAAPAEGPDGRPMPECDAWILRYGNRIVWHRRLSAQHVGMGLFEPASFDLVTAFDVLEHIPEPDVLEVLRQWRLVSKGRMLFSIAHTPHEEHGRVLHVTVKPAEWWERTILEAIGGRVREVGKYTLWEI